MYTHTKTFEYTYSAHIPKQTDMQAQPTQVEVVIFTNKMNAQIYLFTLAIMQV